MHRLSWYILPASLRAQLVKNPPSVQETQLHSWIRKIRWRRDGLTHSSVYSLPCGSAGKESTCNVEGLGSIPGLGRSPGEGKGYPLQYSGLENSLDCLVHGAAKSQTPTFTSLHFMLILYFIKWFLSGGKNIWKPLKCKAWGLPWWLGAKVPTWECRGTCIWSLV